MKILLVLIALCLAGEARAATYLLLSQTNAFAQGILAAAGTNYWTLNGNTLVANTNTVIIGDPVTATNCVVLYASPGEASGVFLNDGVDTATLVVDSANAGSGTGLFINGAPLGGPSMLTNAAGIFDGDAAKYVGGDFALHALPSGGTSPVLIDTSTGAVTQALSPLALSIYIKSGIANPLYLTGNGTTSTIYGDQIWVNASYQGTNWYLNY